MATAKEAKQNKGTVVTSISLRITNNLKGRVDEFIERVIITVNFRILSNWKGEALKISGVQRETNP